MKRKTHIADIRLSNNAGISMPVCRVTDGPLDLDKTGWQTVGTDDATCKRCRAAFAKRYSWAMTSRRRQLWGTP